MEESNKELSVRTDKDPRYTTRLFPHMRTLMLEVGALIGTHLAFDARAHARTRARTHTRMHTHARAHAPAPMAYNDRHKAALAAR